MEHVFSVFSKPWKKESADELGMVISGLGFNAVEFPLRDGYQAEPADAEKSLPLLADKLKAYGITVTSAASSTGEHIFAACAKAGVPLIRIMCGYDIKSKGYMAARDDWKREIDSFLPFCEKYGVKVGIQQHLGAMVNNSMELRNLLEGYPPELVGAVWDAAHSGLANEEPEQALDILYDYLLLANFKNAYYILSGGIERERAVWNYHFTTGEKGLCSWERAVAYLKKRGYSGVFCMPAEYSDEKMVGIYAKKDLAYLKNIVRTAYGE